MTFCDCELCRERAEPCSVSGIKNGRGTRYYRSYRKNRFDSLPEETGVPRRQCGVKHVRADALEGLVLDEVEKYVKEPGRSLAEVINYREARGEADIERQLAAAKRGVAAAREAKRRAGDRYEAQEIDRDEYDAKCAHWDGELVRLTREADDLTALLRREGVTELNISATEAILRRLETNFAERRQAWQARGEGLEELAADLRALISRLYIKPPLLGTKGGEVQVRIRFGGLLECVVDRGNSSAI